MKKLFIIPIISLAVLLMGNAAFATTTDISSPVNGAILTGKPVTFTGNTVTEGQIELQEDGVTIASTTADVNGDWSVTTSNIKSGSHSYTALMTQPQFNMAFRNGQAEPVIEVVDVNNREFLNPINLPSSSSSNDLVVRGSSLYVPIADHQESQISIECSILEYSLPEVILVRQIVLSGDCSAGSIDVSPDGSVAVVSYMDYGFVSYHIVAVDLETGTVIDNFDTEYTMSDAIVFSNDGQSFFTRIGGGLAKFHIVNGAIEPDGAEGYGQDFSPAIAVDPVTGKIAIAEVMDQSIRFVDPEDLTSTTTLAISEAATSFTRLAFSRDGGKLLVVGQDDGTNHVWEIDMDTQSVSNEYDITDYPESVGFTPDNSQYVIGDNFGSGTIFFGVPGGATFTDSIVEPGRAYAMRNTNFIYAIDNNDTSDPITTTNTFVAASYGTDPNGAISTRTVAPGGKVDVSGSGYLPNSDVTITLNSTPVLLATVKTSSSGSFSTTVTIPKNTTLGAHTLVIAGKDANGADVSSVLNLIVANLPATGNNASSQAIFATALIGIGVVLARRQRRLKIS